MIKLNLDKEIKDINGNTIVFDTVNNEPLTTRTAITGMIGAGNSEDFMKAVELGLRIKSAKKEIELTNEDAVFLKQLVGKSKYIDIVKYHITKELE